MLKLDAIRAAVLTGDIPQNVNFAVQSSRVTSILDSYSIEYQVGVFDKEKSTSDIVASVLPAIVLLECLPDRKQETVAIPRAEPKALPTPPSDLRRKTPTIGTSRSWS